MNRFLVTATYDQLRYTLDGALVACYRFLGARRPYFWPLNAAEGSVVRGAGTGDHPHQQGLYLAYGLHGHNGATNIWSDWDEPPYGPCGATHHVRFSRVDNDGFEEWLLYANGAGEPIAEEVRNVRLSVHGTVRRLDWESRIIWLTEAVNAPFHFSARPAPTILQEGRVVTSARNDDTAARENHPADWLDFSGKVGEGRAGLTVFDHPENPDAQGDFWFPHCLLLTHHAPQPFPTSGLTLRFRADVHSGDTPTKSA